MSNFGHHKQVCPQLQRPNFEKENPLSLLTHIRPKFFIFGCMCEPMPAACMSGGCCRIGGSIWPIWNSLRLPVDRLLSRLPIRVLTKLPWPLPDAPQLYLALSIWFALYMPSALKNCVGLAELIAPIPFRPMSMHSLPAEPSPDSRDG